MSSPNIFAEDWQACLHAHYLYVLHAHDLSNEASLRLVLKQVGFDDAALDTIRAEIQTAVQEVAPDMEPDTVEPEPVAAGPAEHVPDALANDMSAAEIVNVEEDVSAVPDITADLGLDAGAGAADVSDAPAAEEAPEPPPDDDLKPTQLSLF